MIMTVRILIAAGLMAALARLVWALLDALLGSSLPSQIVSVGLGASVGVAFYAAAVLRMRIPEAGQIKALVRRRARPGTT